MAARKRQYRFQTWMLNGHPGDVTTACKRLIVRGYNGGLDVMSTTDKGHAATSYHYPRPPEHPLGRAVDFGVNASRSLNAAEATRLKAKFQRWCAAQPDYFLEVFGPDNAHNVKDKRVVQLAEGTALETAHDTHAHCAPAKALPALPLPLAVLDARLALRLWRKWRVYFGLRIIREARAAGIPLALSLALVEQESGFRNVYGHDAVPNPAPKGGAVTKRNYQAVYLPARKANLGMQGVGPCQLTWWEFQDQADREGGCWNPTANMRVAFRLLRGKMGALGLRAALASYNGTGEAAQRYADSVLARRDKWAKRL